MKKIISGQNMSISQEEKNQQFKRVEEAYGNFLSILGYDWENDPNMNGTPKRIAKMYLNEVTRGTYDVMPKITSFENQMHYGGMVFEGNITVKSLCSHHMQPFIGRCHIAYIPDENGKVIGLSKLNRITDWFARRPQLQEQLTQQIHDSLCEILPDNRGVAVLIEAKHMCVYLRGAEDENSVMKTAQMSGFFFDSKLGARDEFYRMISNLGNNKI
jgi:GTP cyclohydrolase I